MALIMEMGANTVRLAHYQNDQYFYDLCDEKGLIVWAEIPYISKHMQSGVENTVSQMKELIIQNYNHPSIAVWGLSNEITMDSLENADVIENHRILNELAHKLDKTRVTTVAAFSTCSIDAKYLTIPDVIAYNHYFGWYGCEALNWHTSHPEQGDYTEEYQAYYHEELIKQLFTRPFVWATYVWNM